MLRSTNINLEYQPPISHPPITVQSMAAATTSGDQATVEFWKEIWIRNMDANKKLFGSFKENGLHKLYKKYDKLPVICMGSGPSLKHYAKYLKACEENGIKYKGNPGILVMSALHNFAYLNDLGIKVDYWLSLDGGEVVIDEQFDGASKKLPNPVINVVNISGKKFEYTDLDGKEFSLEAGQSKDLDASFKEKLIQACEDKLIQMHILPEVIDKEFYIERTKGQKLIAYTGTNPRLWDNWKGEVIWTQSIMPNQDIKRRMDAIEKYEMITSSGGNVLGASMYIAKALFGCNPIIFMGADFSFSYDSKFHSFDSKYDTAGQTIAVRDIYGNKVKTWQSYYNFKQWFDLKSMQIPGVYINCSDGCMGAYETGNIMSITQKHIVDVLEMYRVVDHLKETVEKIDTIEQGLIVF